MLYLTCKGFEVLPCRKYNTVVQELLQDNPIYYLVFSDLVLEYSYHPCIMNCLVQFIIQHLLRLFRFV